MFGEEDRGPKRRVKRRTRSCCDDQIEQEAKVLKCNRNDNLPVNSSRVSLDKRGISVANKKQVGTCTDTKSQTLNTDRHHWIKCSFVSDRASPVTVNNSFSKIPDNSDNSKYFSQNSTRDGSVLVSNSNTVDVNKNYIASPALCGYVGPGAAGDCRPAAKMASHCVPNKNGHLFVESVQPLRTSTPAKFNSKVS